jgi:ribosomal protein S18 acetylase RimI-like enzyme
MNEAGATASESTLTPDVWLSGIFGYPALRVGNDPAGSPLSMLDVRQPFFAYAKLDVREVSRLSTLTDAGFRVVDTALTFDGTISGASGNRVRFARPEDRAQVSRIAGTAFRYSRFHLDPLVPAGVADAIKSSWAGNYFDGKRGDGMVVAERDGKVAGFLQLLRAPQDGLIIDLIGVDPARQGHGLGREMILHAARHGIGDDRIPATITVGTQAANTPSVRLYESLGLRLSSAQYVAHHHGRRTH